jgi:hypothetical protein
MLGKILENVRIATEVLKDVATQSIRKEEVELGPRKNNLNISHLI